MRICPRLWEDPSRFWAGRAPGGRMPQGRGMDKPTNVLSFPAGGPGAPEAAALLGDIVMAFETVAAEAARDDKSIEAHVSHLVIHGFLHLIGYDHEEAAGAEAMEALETRSMKRLGRADP